MNEREAGTPQFEVDSEESGNLENKFAPPNELKKDRQHVVEEHEGRRNTDAEHGADDYPDRLLARINALTYDSPDIDVLKALIHKNSPENLYETFNKKLNALWEAETRKGNAVILERYRAHHDEYVELVRSATTIDELRTAINAIKPLLDENGIHTVPDERIEKYLKGLTSLHAAPNTFGFRDKIQELFRESGAQSEQEKAARSPQKKGSVVDSVKKFLGLS